VSTTLLYVIVKNFLPDFSTMALAISLIATALIIWVATSYFLFRNKHGLPVLSDKELKEHALKHMTHIVLFADDATSHEIDSFSQTAMFDNKPDEARATSFVRFPLATGHLAYAFRFEEGEREVPRELAISKLRLLPGVLTVETGFDRIDGVR
jgi:hypothetical protein